MKRRLATLTLLCALLVLGAVARPALSLRPWHAEPVDFSIAPPAGAVLGKASVRGEGVVSKPLRAPKRFNLVGLTWSNARAQPGVAVRTRTDGGRWSRWTTVYSHAEDSPDPGVEGRARATSAPSWVGAADWIQYRVTQRPRGLRIHFVNVRGDATAADRARSAIRRVASAGVASIASALPAGSAQAAEQRPAMVSRDDWGARACPPRQRADYGEVRAAFIHHTVNSNNYTRAEAPDVVLGICRFHRNTNGWNDVGYNFLVDRFGTIYEGRAGGVGQAVVGAQAQGYNSLSTGIANLGTFTSVRQSDAALQSIARLIRWKLPLHGVPTAGTTTLTSTGGPSNRFPAGRRVRLERVIGHRDTGATSCPGDALYRQLPRLRRMVGSLAPRAVGTQLLAELGISRRSVRFGASAPVTGTLSVAGGPPLARQPVEVQALIRKRWRTVAAVSTGEQGELSAEVKPSRNRSLRVRYAGFGDLRPATSPAFTIGVRPRVALARTPRRVPSGTRVIVRGRVLPRKPRVFQVLQLKRGRRYRTVGTHAVRTRRNGRFRTSFVPAGSGSYRFYLVARGGRTTARSRSRKVGLRSWRSRGGGAAAP